MRKLVLVHILVLLAFLTGVARAQEKPPVLGLSTGSAQIDGAIAAGEYSLTAELPKAKLSLLWTEDTLAVAVTAETKGWVAVGLGSRRMDKAIIFIGYATGNQARLKVQKGAGHSHTDVDSQAMSAYAVAEKGNVTTLEVALKASSFISPKQTRLDLIVAFGGSDSFSDVHRFRTSLGIALQR